MFYFDFAEALNMLNDADAGRLFKAAIAYGHYGVVPELDGMVGMAWSLIKPKIDQDGVRYDNTCVQNAYNRYVGECKKHGSIALSREAWEVEIYAPRQRALTSVDGGSNPSLTTTTTPTTTAATDSTVATDTKANSIPTAKAEAGGGEGDVNALRNAALEKLEGYRQGG